MALPNVIINLANGALGRVAASADGVAGMILTGSAEGNLELGKVYMLSSTRDLTALGVTVDDNPLIVKEVTAFYSQAGDGAELYLLVSAPATTLTQMCAIDDTSALRKLIDGARRRIRLVGINRLPSSGYSEDTTTTGIDKDVVTAAAAAQSVADSYADQVNPFRVFLPAMLWDGKTDKLWSPRESSYNRIGVVMACDARFGDVASPAIGQVLGRAASIPVNQSIARVKSGAIQAADGYLSDNSTVESKSGTANLLNDAGYIIYRTFIGKSGYYLNDDHMSAPLSDDYSSLNLGRVIDKAIIQAYIAYIDEINDNITVDKDGKIPPAICTYFEGKIENAVAITMQGEISSFDAYIDPTQNVLSSSRMDIVCKIVPTSILREIRVSLGFSNPALKS